MPGLIPPMVAYPNLLTLTSLVPNTPISNRAPLG